MIQGCIKRIPEATPIILTQAERAELETLARSTKAVATGKVMTAHKRRRRRVEFLDFMNEIVAAHPDTAIHVVLDNLSTHKPKNDRWLKRHPNVRFHFTPTHASWLNQIEIWFSILQGNSLHNASFTSVKQLREHLDAFIAAYNENPKPFAWTKSEVHQKRLKTCFADQ